MFQMVSINKVEPGDTYRFVLSPNCSISWRELVIFYLFTCVVALAIGVFFTLQGLWLVLGLSLLALLMRPWIGLYMRLIGLEGVHAALGTAYLDVTLIGLLPVALHVLIDGIFRGLGDTTTALRIAGVSVVVNALLDPLMIHWLAKTSTTHLRYSLVSNCTVADSEGFREPKKLVERGALACSATVYSW